MTGTDECTKYLVTEVSRFISIDGCNISMDRYFTSVSLAEWGIDRKFTVMGTMRYDRKGIPKEMKSLKDREEKSIIFAHSQKNIMMVTYIDKKKLEKTNIICLTAMHDRVQVTNDQRLKSQVIVMYDHTKRGVDVVDLISCYHSTRMKSKRSSLTAFSFMLDTIRTNSKRFQKTRRRSSTTLNSHINWGNPLCCRKSDRGLRIQMACKLQTIVLQKVRRVLGLLEVYQRPLTDPEKAVTLIGCCHKCVESIIGTKTYKTDHNKLNSKLKTKCRVSSGFICKKHQYKLEFTCEDCFEK